MGDIVKKRTFCSNKGNVPKFPYSQAVIYGDLIYISGQPPVDHETQEGILMYSDGKKVEG